MSGEKHEEMHAGIALIEQFVTISHRANFAKGAHAVDLRGRQDGECVGEVASAVEVGELGGNRGHSA